MNVQINGNILTGTWKEDQDSVLVRATISEDGVLKFENAFISKYDRYIDGQPVLYRFETADINSADDMITGALRLYSIEEREPERPMFITLHKKQKKNTDLSSGNHRNIRIYPNPFASKVTFEFELEEKASQVKVLIYSQLGVNVQSYTLGAMEAGKHSFSISPSVSDGIYIAHIMADKNIYRTIIVKKENSL